MKLLRRLFCRNRGFVPRSVTIITPDYRLEWDAPREGAKVFVIPQGRCLSEGECALRVGDICSISPPCKYKGLCADAPITEQEV